MASTGEVWKLGHRPALDGVRGIAAVRPALRLLAVVMPALVALVFAATVRGPAGGFDDWTVAQRASALLWAGDLRMYAHIPEAQMGPLAIALAGLPHGVYTVVVSALLGLFLWLVTPATRRGAVVACLAGSLAAVGWAFYAMEGHADDALVLVGVGAMVRAARTGSGRLGVVGFVVALAGKPTAAMFLPLLIPAGGVTSAAAAVSLAAVVYGPFVAADPAGFLGAGGGINAVHPDSLPGMLGAAAGAAFPAWVRPAQMLGGMLLCWWGWRRLGPAVVLWVFTWRALLEPTVFHAYVTSIFLAAVLVDLWRRVPFMTPTVLAVWVATSVPAVVLAADGLVRLLLLLLPLLLCLVSRRLDQPTSATPATTRPPVETEEVIVAPCGPPGAVYL